MTFEFDVTPRHDWLWLAAWQGRLLVLNGTHHLLALMKAGRQHAECLVRSADSFADLQALGWNPQDPGLFRPNELMAMRPPMLRDYLDEQYAADVAIHLRENYPRFAFRPSPASSRASSEQGLEAPGPYLSMLPIGATPSRTDHRQGLPKGLACDARSAPLTVICQGFMIRRRKDGLLQSARVVVDV